MGRPPLPLGTSGKVLFATLPNGRVRARVKFRDYDGRVRLVSKVGASRAAAERALKAELTSRQAPGGVGAITSATRMATLADAWMEADHGWSTGTRRTYGSVINKQVKPAFGQLCIREVTPGVVSRALSAIAKSSGPGAAKRAAAGSLQQDHCVISSQDHPQVSSGVTWRLCIAARPASRSEPVHKQ